LLAAHAARLKGISVTVFSKKQKSQMRGAQYMHRPIPGLRLAGPVKLAYMLHGNIDDYKAKVYGDNADDDLVVSPKLFAGYHEAWSIRQAYGLLWEAYRDIVIDTNITQEVLAYLVNGYDTVLSTIPAPLLCYNKTHQFKQVKVWIDQKWYGDNPRLNLSRYGTDHVVICNGKPNDPDHARQTGWYRTSLIYGQSNTEWSVKSSVIPMDAKQVVKPIATDCNCWPTIVRAGRYGQWAKGVLSHESFDMALEVFQ
jgi:hypothetical protein